MVGAKVGFPAETLFCTWQVKASCNNCQLSSGGVSELEFATEHASQSNYQVRCLLALSIVLEQELCY
jgi:hypothetical protein